MEVPNVIASSNLVVLFAWSWFRRPIVLLAIGSLRSRHGFKLMIWSMIKSALAIDKSNFS